MEMIYLLEVRPWATVCSFIWNKKGYNLRVDTFLNVDILNIFHISNFIKLSVLTIFSILFVISLFGRRIMVFTNFWWIGSLFTLNQDLDILRRLWLKKGTLTSMKLSSSLAYKMRFVFPKQFTNLALKIYPLGLVLVVLVLWFFLRAFPDLYPDFGLVFTLGFGLLGSTWIETVGNYRNLILGFLLQVHHSERDISRF